MASDGAELVDSLDRELLRDGSRARAKLSQPFGDSGERRGNDSLNDRDDVREGDQKAQSLGDRAGTRWLSGEEIAAANGEHEDRREPQGEQAEE